MCMSTVLKSIQRVNTLANRGAYMARANLVEKPISMYRLISVVFTNSIKIKSNVHVQRLVVVEIVYDPVVDKCSMTLNMV